MRRIKRLGALLLAFAMLFTLVPFMTAGAVDTTGTIVLVMNSDEFTVNGAKTKIDAQGSKPVQTGGYTMLPLRAILEATGGTLTYDANTQKVTIVRGGDTVVLTLNNKAAVVNGANRTLGAAPYATNGRTMVHIRTLELFGMKVDWDEKTNNVTVSYVDPGKVYNLTLKNGMTAAYTSIQIAPMNTSNWSGNLLGADTLAINGNIIVQAPIADTNTWQQLRLGYKDATSGNVLYHTVSNINLTGMRDRAEILMNNATAPQVGVDGASSNTKTITLFLVNKTGYNLSGVFSKLPTDQFYGTTNLLGGTVLVNGATAQASFAYNPATPYYDFYATYATTTPTTTTGTTTAASGGVTYKNVLVSVAGAQTFQTITLNANGTVAAGGSTGSGSTEITFKNSTGTKVYEIRMSTKTNLLKNADVVWSDSSGLKNGSTVKFNVNLESAKMAFGVYTKKNPTSSTSPACSALLNFKSTSATSAKITASVEDDAYELMDWNDCEECEDKYLTDSDGYKLEGDKYDSGVESAKAKHNDLKDKYGSTPSESTYQDKIEGTSAEDHYDKKSGDAKLTVSAIKTDGSSSSSSSNGDGDVKLNLLNAYSNDIKALYVVEKSDYNDKDKTKQSDFEDDYDDLLDGDTVKSDKYALIEDALSSGETNYLVWVSGSSSKLGKTSIKVNSDAEWASIVITGRDSAEIKDSESKQTLVFLENDSGDSAKVTLKSDSSKDSDVTATIDDEKTAYKWVTTKNASKWEFDTKITGFDEKEIDLDDYDGFVHAKFDDDEFSFYEADD